MNTLLDLTIYLYVYRGAQEHYTRSNNMFVYIGVPRNIILDLTICLYVYRGAQEHYTRSNNKTRSEGLTEAENCDTKVIKFSLFTRDSHCNFLCEIFGFKFLSKLSDFIRILDFRLLLSFLYCHYHYNYIIMIMIMIIVIIIIIILL